MSSPQPLARAAWMPISLAAVLAAVVMTTACTAVPRGNTLEAATGCERLDAEAGRTQAGLDAAREAQEDAWRLVLPFAVAARYASAKSAVHDAEEKLQQLQAQADRQGCHLPE